MARHEATAVQASSPSPARTTPTRSGSSAGVPGSGPGGAPSGRWNTDPTSKSRTSRWRRSSVVQDGPDQSGRPSRCAGSARPRPEGWPPPPRGRVVPRRDQVGLRDERGGPGLAAPQSAEHLFEQPTIALVPGEPAGLGPRRRPPGDPDVAVGAGHLLGDVRLSHRGGPDVGAEGGHGHDGQRPASRRRRTGRPSVMPRAGRGARRCRRR